MVFGMFRRNLMKQGVAAGSIGICWYFKDEIKNTAIGSVRFGRAVVTVAEIVRDYTNTNRLIEESVEVEEKFLLKSKVHKRGAEKLLDLCCRNGGAFIKVGQHLGSLEYLLPIEYVSTLKVLHKDAPKSSIEALLKVFKAELHKEPLEVFSEFCMEPLGTASLAQVHKARRLDGRMVAVKIQHPLVLDHSKIDLIGMEILVSCVSWLFPEFQFKWLAKEAKKNLPKELNFFSEAQNAEKVAKMYSHLPWLKIPEVHWDLTSKRVVTMEYCDGGAVNDLAYLRENKIDPYDVSRKLGALYSEMIFVNGYVHCDPHPGNVFVNKNGNQSQIVLLDHGLYTTLTPDFRITYAKLWQSILKADTEGIVTYSKRLGVGELSELFACMVSGRSWDSISKGINKKSLSKEEEQENKKYAALLVPQITNVLNKVSSNMLLVFKTNDLLRGIEFSLKTHVRMNSFLSMARCCITAIYDEERGRCNSSWCLFRNNMAESFARFKLTVYSFYLFFISLSTFS